jgi:hypothetical protein
MKRSLGIPTFVAAVAAVELLAATAFAGQISSASINVVPSVVARGATVRISGSVSPQACASSDMVTVTGASALFPPDGFGPTVQRDASGNFGVDYTVPLSAPTGRYDIGLRCGGGNPGVSAVLTVSQSSGAARAGTTRTGLGWAALWMVGLIACLLVAGTAFVLRRRSKRGGP